MSEEGWQISAHHIEVASGEIYMSRVAPFFAPAREADFVSRTTHGGLPGILEDEELVRILALASILCGAERTLDQFIDGLSRFGRGIQEVKAMNERYRHICGIDAVVMGDTRVWSLF
jgi:hypothetical protein